MAVVSPIMGHRTFGELFATTPPPDDIQLNFMWAGEQLTFRDRVVRKCLSLRIPIRSIRQRNGDLLRVRSELAAALHVSRQLISRGARQASVLYLHTQVNALASVRLMQQVPTVVSADMVASLVAQELPPKWRWTLRPNAWLERRVFRTAAACIFWSAWARDAAVRDYQLDPIRTHVIPPGVDLEKLRPSSPRPPGDKLRLLFVGQDFNRKGGRDLMRAMSDPRLRGRVTLDLVSSSPAAAAAAKSMDGVAVHAGVTAYSPAWLKLFATADVFVFPTHHEAFGLAAVEALAAGLPVIATRIGALPEIVPDGRAGLLVTPGNITALSLAINSFLSDHPRMKNMAAFARQTAVEKFNSRRNTSCVWQVLVKTA